MIGTTEASDADESLAQKNPSRLENDARATASVPAFTAVTLMHQKDTFQDKITASSAVEATPGAPAAARQTPVAGAAVPRRSARRPRFPAVPDEGQIDRNQHAGRRHKFGREHPQQDAARPSRWDEGHGIGRGRFNEDGQDGRAEGDRDAVPGMRELVDTDRA